jgi:oxygen-independent coproporphyrinogen-3 oxidase
VIGLYVHIPFCAAICNYCNFNRGLLDDSLKSRYVAALLRELRASAGRYPAADTLYFGGGTPSLLEPLEVRSIIETSRAELGLTEDAEITLEANPETIDPERLDGFRQAGVNRLSFGVQSFHDDELAALDRIHTSAEAEQGYGWAREGGFRRVNLDLIYGLPQQPLARWQASLERAIALAPDHMSLYALTVEDGTALAYDIEHGSVREPDGDAQAEMYEWSQGRMAVAGYRQYEISNWSLPGQECRHNLVYWRNGDWLGLGAGAHSHLAGLRFADVYSPKRYVQLVGETAQAPPEGAGAAALLKSMRQVTFVEEPRPELARADTLIMGLRLNEGVSLSEFRRRFGSGADDAYAATFEEFASLGLLECANGRVRLTERGRLLANEVFVRLLPD